MSGNGNPAHRFLKAYMDPEPEKADYRWKISKDHLSEGENSRVGTEGPGNLDESVTDNATHWSAYDDDGICYYEGMLYGDFDGFEPLDDFCTPDAGAVSIKINGEFL